MEGRGVGPRKRGEPGHVEKNLIGAAKHPDQEPDVETNTGPDMLRDDLRCRDQRRDATRRFDRPRGDEGLSGEEPAGGGFTPALPMAETDSILSMTRTRRMRRRVTMSARSTGSTPHRLRASRTNKLTTGGKAWLNAETLRLLCRGRPRVS